MPQIDLLHGNPTMSTLTIRVTMDQLKPEDGTMVTGIVVDHRGRAVFSRSDSYVGVMADAIATTASKMIDAFMWGNDWRDVRAAMKRCRADAHEYAQTYHGGSR